MREILNIIEEHAMNERLDKIALEGQEYQDLLKQIDVISENIEFKEIDDLLDAYNRSNSRYNQLAYRQGFMDCVKLFKELGIL